MGRARITRADYDRLVAAFREEPGNLLQAARAAGVSRTVARRAWRQGWDGPDWARCIGDVVRAEQVAGRALACRVADRSALAVDTMVDDATAHAIRARAEEALIVTLGHQLGRQLQGGLSQMAELAPEMSRAAAEQLRADLEGGQVGAERAIGLVRELADLGNQWLKMMETIQRFERVRLGEATEVVRLDARMGKLPPERSVAELKADLEDLARQEQQMKRQEALSRDLRSRLQVIEGGGSDEQPDE